MLVDYHCGFFFMRFCQRRLSKCTFVTYFSPFTSSEQVMPRRIMSFIVGFRRVRKPSHERFCCFVQPASARAMARG